MVKKSYQHLHIFPRKPKLQYLFVEGFSQVGHL